MDIKDVNTMGAKFSQYEVLIPQRSFLNVYDIQIGLGYCVQIRGVDISDVFPVRGFL